MVTSVCFRRCSPTANACACSDGVWQHNEDHGELELPASFIVLGRLHSFMMIYSLKFSEI